MFTVTREKITLFEENFMVILLFSILLDEMKYEEEFLHESALRPQLKNYFIYMSSDEI